jgi:hypothetical protein
MQEILSGSQQLQTGQRHKILRYVSDKIIIESVLKWQVFLKQNTIMSIPITTDLYDLGSVYLEK